MFGLNLKLGLRNHFIRTNGSCVFLISYFQSGEDGPNLHRVTHCLYTATIPGAVMNTTRLLNPITDVKRNYWLVLTGLSSSIATCPQKANAQESVLGPTTLFLSQLSMADAGILTHTFVSSRLDDHSGFSPGLTRDMTLSLSMVQEAVASVWTTSRTFEYIMPNSQFTFMHNEYWCVTVCDIVLSIYYLWCHRCLCHWVNVKVKPSMNAHIFSITRLSVSWPRALR